MEKLQYTNIFDAIADDPAEAAYLDNFRADTMLVLRNYFQSKGWKQADIMANLGITQPRVSELTRGKVDKFSSDKLIGSCESCLYRSNQRYNCTIIRLLFSNAPHVP